MIAITLVFAAAALAQVAPGGAPAYQQAATLPARIISFTAEPASIKPGQTVTLRWAAENPQAITIDQGVGVVRPRGDLRLTPKATTTYVLSVRGPNGALTKDVTVTVEGTVPVGKSQIETSRKDAPRAADGKPDLTGVYNASFGGGRGRGAAAAPPPADGIARTPTVKPGNEKFKVVRGPEDAGLTSDCMPLGVPGSFNVPYPFQIIQAPNFITIFYEYPEHIPHYPDGRTSASG